MSTTATDISSLCDTFSHLSLALSPLPGDIFCQLMPLFSCRELQTGLGSTTRCFRHTFWKIYGTNAEFIQKLFRFLLNTPQNSKDQESHVDTFFKFYPRPSKPISITLSLVEDSNTHLLKDIQKIQKFISIHALILGSCPSHTLITACQLKSVTIQDAASCVFSQSIPLLEEIRFENKISTALTVRTKLVKCDKENFLTHLPNLKKVTFVIAHRLNEDILTRIWSVGIAAGNKQTIAESQTLISPWEQKNCPRFCFYSHHTV